MRQTQLVQLDSLEEVGVSLIVSAPSGVVYANQTGGHCCRQSELEGALIPIRQDGEGEGYPLTMHFLAAPHNGWGAIGDFGSRDADLIDSVLDRWGLPWVRVDRDRFVDSQEAWVWVRIESSEPESSLPMLEGFEATRGILTWDNSD